MYDLFNDPYELERVHAGPAYAGARADLAESLVAGEAPEHRFGGRTQGEGCNTPLNMHLGAGDGVRSIGSA